MSDMSNYKLKTIGIGSKFTYGGISWVLLQKTKTAALCLAEKILFNKTFDEEDNNNWAESSLRKHLNGKFLDSLAAAGADKAAFTPFTVDLTADDGLKDYSKVKDRISLITCDLYRKHRYTIPNANDWWWTVTPWSVASQSYSCSVSPSGTLSYNYAYRGNIGVRPLCNLNSSILVDVTDLKVYTPEEVDENRKPEQKESEMSSFCVSIDYEAEYHRCVGSMANIHNELEEAKSAILAMSSIINEQKAKIAEQRSKSK